jgi:hypothetical protein
MLAALLLVAAAAPVTAPATAPAARAPAMVLEAASFSDVVVVPLSSPSFRLVGESAPPVAQLVLTPRLAPGRAPPRALVSPAAWAVLADVPDASPAAAFAPFVPAPSAEPPPPALESARWRPS